MCKTVVRNVCDELKLEVVEATVEIVKLSGPCDIPVDKTSDVEFVVEEVTELFAIGKTVVTDVANELELDNIEVIAVVDKLSEPDDKPVDTTSVVECVVDTSVPADVVFTEIGMDDVKEVDDKVET